MNLSILKAMALVAHGNAFLQKEHSIKQFYPHHPAFVFDAHVRFVRLSTVASELPVLANNPVEWLQQLKHSQCRTLRLRHAPSKPATSDGVTTINDRLLAGFVGGGGEWWIEATYTNYCHQWFWKEEVTHQDAPDKKIWTTTYGSTLEPCTALPLDTVPTRLVQQHLGEALMRVQQFSEQQQLDSWTNTFNHALSILHGDPINLDYFKKYFPTDYFSEHFFRLAGAADAAWVFGGMGSWNDLGFEKPDDELEYANCSNQLYQAVVASIVYALNSTELQLNTELRG